VNSRTAALTTSVLALLLPLAACGSGDDEKDRSATEVLTAAKKQFDEARSVHLTLATKSTPSSGDGVLGATGTLTHQPAFEGTVKVMLGGFNADVPVVSVDGEVHAKLPMTVKYAVIDPAEYGAPDPAEFADPERGISGLLLKLEDAEEQGEKRSGSQVLTTYSGTLLGSYVKPIIPSADAKGTYDTVVGVDQDDRIATLKVTGDFFSGSEDETFDMVFDDYDEAVTVDAPVKAP
jgi:lipoprotein LprG